MRKDYKENPALENMGKRGQVSLFVIIAIVIIGIVIFVSLSPKINILQTSEVNPSSFLSNCIQPEVEDTLTLLNKQGGYVAPDNYLTYQDENIQYLCYTSENYLPCVVQQPLLVSHIENEIKNAVTPKARECVNNLAKLYEKRGFDVSTTPGDINVSITSGKIAVDFLSPMTVSKEDTQTFRKFAINLDSELYDLYLTATSIIQFESTLGDSETSLYIQYYPDLKIEKLRRSPDTIYTLSNVVTGEEFTFATRSLVWPQGYGLDSQ